jgi:nucleotide-binding universal stress UspA family protein
VRLFELTRILVPTNLGEPSRGAIRYGVAFARQFEAKLLLVHALSEKEYDAAIETERVIEELMPEATPPPAARESGSRESLASNAAREELGQLLDPADVQATGAEYIIRSAGTGGPGDAIVSCALELGVELIIMGKHRMGFVEHLLAGSVAEKVLRKAPCPVLIVQHPEHEFIVPEVEGRTA